MATKKTGKDALLWWCQEITKGYENVHIQNFHTSWSDGLAFCAIIHKFHPEKIPWASLRKDNPAKNHELAFSAAESIGIPRLLDVEDMLIPKPEQFSVMTYLSQYFHHFNSKAQSGTGYGIANIQTGGVTFQASGPSPPIPKAAVRAAMQAHAQSASSAPASSQASAPAPPSRDDHAEREAKMKEMRERERYEREAQEQQREREKERERHAKLAAEQREQQLRLQREKEEQEREEAKLQAEQEKLQEERKRLALEAEEHRRREQEQRDALARQRAEEKARLQKDMEALAIREKLDAMKQQQQDQPPAVPSRSPPSGSDSPAKPVVFVSEATPVPPPSSAAAAMPKTRFASKPSAGSKIVSPRGTQAGEGSSRVQFSPNREKPPAQMIASNGDGGDEEFSADAPKEWQDKIRQIREKRLQQQGGSHVVLQKPVPQPQPQQPTATPVAVKPAGISTLQRATTAGAGLGGRDKSVTSAPAPVGLGSPPRRVPGASEYRPAPPVPSAAPAKGQLGRATVHTEDQPASQAPTEVDLIRKRREELEKRQRENKENESRIREQEAKLKERESVLLARSQELQHKQIVRKQTEEDLAKRRAQIEAEQWANLQRERELEAARAKAKTQNTKTLPPTPPTSTTTTQQHKPLPSVPHKGSHTKAEALFAKEQEADARRVRAAAEREKTADEIRQRAASNPLVAREQESQQQAQGISVHFVNRGEQLAELVLEGYLMKQDPGGFKLWRRRWFSLVKGNQLMYWETSDTAQASNPPLGTIHLSTVSNILPEHHASKHIFNIDTPERVYVLQAPTKEVMEYWITGLRTALSKYCAKPLDDHRTVSWSVKDFMPKEGWLYKQGGLLTAYMWSKYWFTLKHGFLSWSSKPGQRPEGRIALYRCHFEDYYNATRPLGCKIVTRSKETFLIAADTEEGLAGWINALLKQKIAIEETIECISI